VVTLIEARPGAGKTTAMRRLVELLRDRDLALTGFSTAEVREDRRRVGFSIETVGGERGVLAHVDHPGPPRVGRYGVDLAEFERLALPALAAPADIVVIDELGKMELASSAFVEAVEGVLDGDATVVATVQVHRHPITDRIKRRADAEVVRLTRENRDELPVVLADRLAHRAA
jgi:nucleoside-triphosphatase